VLTAASSASIIEPRVEELFSAGAARDQKAGQEVCWQRLVLTGGTQHAHGMPELAEDVLALPVAGQLPGGFGGLTDVVKSPQHATAWACCSTE